MRPTGGLAVSVQAASGKYNSTFSFLEELTVHDLH